MPNIDALDLKNPGSPAHGGTWGNVSTAVRSITLAADAEHEDVLRFIKLQANTRLLDATLFIDDTATTISGDLGYTTVSGDNSDPDHFIAGQALAAGGRFEADEDNPPVVVGEDFYVTLTLTGTGSEDAGAIDAGTTVTLVLLYEFTGHE